MISEEDRKLMSEVKKDPKAYRWLLHKANWEGMTLYAVLRGYGDPRKFKEVYDD